jgi:hypothetical protein
MILGLVLWVVGTASDLIYRSGRVFPGVATTLVPSKMPTCDPDLAREATDCGLGAANAPDTGRRNGVGLTNARRELKVVARSINPTRDFGLGINDAIEFTDSIDDGVHRGDVITPRRSPPRPGFRAEHRLERRRLVF